MRMVISHGKKLTDGLRQCYWLIINKHSGNGPGSECHIQVITGVTFHQICSSRSATESQDRKHSLGRIKIVIFQMVKNNPEF
jgi:hypothetical protein